MSPAETVTGPPWPANVWVPASSTCTTASRDGSGGSFPFGNVVVPAEKTSTTAPALARCAWVIVLVPTPVGFW